MPLFAVGGGDPTSTPWVVATVDNVSIRHNSWYWGSYYETYSEAFKAFAAKEPYGYFAENANELRSHVSA